MTLLTVDSAHKVETSTDLIVVSSATGLILICKHCTLTRNIYLYQQQESVYAAEQGIGIVILPHFQQCQCFAHTLVEQRTEDAEEARYPSHWFSRNGGDTA